jgi:pyroglutamyl-peptidase
VLHFLAATGRRSRAGFIHVPYAPEQVLDKAGSASMSLEAMARGIEAAIAVAQSTALDLHVSEGTLD